MRVLIFSEEYERVTKGTFRVWSGYARQAVARDEILVLMNSEHWGVDEARQLLPGISIARLPFPMPVSVIGALLGSVPSRPLRIAREGLIVLLNLAVAPFVIAYLAVRLRQLGPDAVLSHNGGWPGGALCRWMIVAAALAGVPRRILVVHSHPAPEPRALGSLARPWRRFQSWLVGRSATAVVAVSDSVRVALQGHFSGRAVVKVHNGIDVEEPPRPARKLDWSPTAPCVGFVGALYPHKGAHVLVEAFSSVRAPAELALLGPGDAGYADALRARAQASGRKVSFLGFHEDVDTFLDRIAVLAVPSVAQESFGLVILEAMKHKLPVICSDFGGMKEIVRDGVTGKVVPAGDAVALARALDELLADPDGRRKMGAAGYSLLHEKFTIKHMAERYELVLQG